MSTVSRRFLTTGMHCPSCSMLIQMDVGDLPGVTSVTSDHRSAITEVTFDDDVLSPADIIAAVVKVGYGAELAEE